MYTCMYNIALKPTAFQPLSVANVILATALRGGCYQSPHFKDEDTETQKDKRLSQDHNSCVCLHVCVMGLRGIAK